jgi:hypothetical protein
MTKQEAIEALKKGERLTHLTFTEDEFIYIQDGKMFDETSMPIDENHFWNYRNSYIFDNGWSIFKLY